MTLFTRGKKAITTQLADESDADYAKFAGAIKHIAGDRMVREACPLRIEGRGLRGEG